MNTGPLRSLSPAIRTVLVLSWVAIFALVLYRDSFIRTIDTRAAVALERDRRVEYQSIYFRDAKIGYVEQQFLPQEDNTLRVRQQAVMQLAISGETYPVELELDARIGGASELLDFRFSFSSPFYQMTATGEVAGTVVSFALDTGGNVIEDTVTLERPPVLSTSRRGFLLGQGIEAGEKVKIPWFDPFSLTAKNSVVEYRGREKTLINQRVYNLHRFTEVFSGARVNSWLDDDGIVVKEESPAGFVFIREPEFRARAMTEPSDDLLASVAVPVTGTMIDLTGRTSARYRLTLPDEPRFDLSSGRQRFADSILTVTREDLSDPPPATVAGAPCGEATEALASTPYIQSDAPDIVERSRAITADADTDLAAVRALADWVYRSLDKRPVIGIPDALTTLKARIGDCNEHASLFAALARAAGIPTRVAVGVVYQQEAFYYHAWNEVCVDGRWISLDTTTNEFPAGLSHLKFIEGELQEQIKIGALLNTLQIEPLPDEPDDTGGQRP